MFFSNYKRKLALILLIIAAISSFFIKELENYQFYLLPLIVFALLFCLRKGEVKVLLACALFWFAIEVYSFPIRFFDLSKSSFLLSQLENDQNGLALRSFSLYLRKYKAHHSYLNKNLNTNADSWLNARPSTSFIVTGNADLLKLVFPDKNRFIDFLVSKLNNFKLKSNFLYYDSKYAIALTPKELFIPREPEELSAALISRMSLALSTDTTKDLKDELLTREKMAARSANYIGNWKSGTARSWAYFTDATFALIRVTQEPSTELCDSMKKKFAIASSLAISKKSPPELLAYIYSNAAVGGIVCEQDYKKAKILIEKARKVSSQPSINTLLQINSEQLRNY